MSKRPGSTEGAFIDPLCTIEMGKKHYSYADKAMEEVQRIGIQEPERPCYEQVHETIFPGSRAGQPFDGRMPATVRKMSYDQVSYLYNLLNAWYAYINHKLSYWKILRSQADGVRGTTKAYLVQIYHKVDGHSMEAARNMADHDVRYVEDNAEYEKCCAVYALLEAQQKAASHNLDLVSREITIRGDEIRSNSRYRGFNERMMGAVRDADIPEQVSFEGGNNGTRAPAPPQQPKQGGSPKRSRWDS